MQKICSLRNEQDTGAEAQKLEDKLMKVLETIRSENKDMNRNLRKENKQMNDKIQAANDKLHKDLTEKYQEMSESFTERLNQIEQNRSEDGYYDYDTNEDEYEGAEEEDHSPPAKRRRWAY